MNQPPNLQEIVALAKRQRLLMELIDEQENALSALKAELRCVQEEDLPSAMMEAGGLKKLVLDSGEEITIKEDFVVGIPQEHKDEAFKWLESHGFGAVIGTVVQVEFAKGELEQAQKLLLTLAKSKYSARLTRNVHWQTLKALISEQSRAKKAIPLELFGAHPFNKAIVKIQNPKG